MFNKKIIFGLWALFMAQVSFAGGTTCITVQSGNWSDNSTWNCGGSSIPQSGSDVTIKPNHTVLLDVDTAEIRFLLVEAGGDLNVMASANGLSINVSIASTSSIGIDLSQASIDLFGDLTINADDIAIKLGSVIGQFGLTLNSAGETRLMGKIGDNSSNSPTSLTTDAPGITVFDVPNDGVNSPNIIVYGARTFNDDMLLAQYTHMTGNFGAITFNGTINTDSSVVFEDLVFSSINNVALSFNNDVGEIKQLGNLEVFNSTGAIIGINSAAISTTGIQAFTGDIVLGSDVIMTAQSVNITDNVDNAGFDLTLNVSDNLLASTITGILSGAGDFYKSGLGDLTFSSQSTQTGNVILKEGKLINNSLVADLFTAAPIISLAPGTTAQIGVQLLGNTFDEVNLQTDQMLIGSGFCDSRLNVLDGKVSPGFSSSQIASRLSINNMVMDNQSELIIQLNGTSSEGGYDQVIVDGATLTGATLSLTLGFIPDIGDTFKIIDVTGPPPVTGAFDGLPEGDTIIINGWILSISYSGGGNDVVLTVVGSTRYYVDADAAPLGDGLSWGTAFNTLQDALEVSINGEIWVAAGVYYPDEGGLQIDDDRSAAFTLKDDVSIYGGFDGTETDVNQRNPELNVTILSGDITQNDVYVNADNIVLTTGDVVSPNSYHVAAGSAVSLNSVLDGFTINAGQAFSVNGVPNIHGGGIYCGNNTSGPSINNMVFIANQALEFGGATYGCSQNVTNTQYINNFADDISGAVRAFGGYFENVLFQGNSSSINGGAMRSNLFPITLINVKFIENESILANGGGLNLSADATLENVLFQGNNAGSNSGDKGGALYIQGSANVSLTNVTFTGNNAGDLGGAITSRSTGTLDIRNSIIWNNQDSTGQGTLSASIRNLTGGITTISNSLIQGSGSSSNWDMAAGIDGGNNLDQDPLFITDTDPTIAPTSVGNAHLMDVSIVIDAGDDSFVTTATDLDGINRIQGASVDMGAYENIPEEMFKDGFE